jgi:hypothetical protein
MGKLEITKDKKIIITCDCGGIHTLTKAENGDAILESENENTKKEIDADSTGDKKGLFDEFFE